MSTKITAWYSGIGELNEKADSKGYTVEQGSAVVSVLQSELLASPAVKKALRVEPSGSECKALSDLWSFQNETVVSFLNRFSVEIDSDYLEEMDEELSQIIYDGEDQIRALLLCRSNEEEIFVEILLGATKASEYIMTALQSFIKAAAESQKDRHIVMVAATKTILPLLRRVLDKKYEIKELGTVNLTRDDADEEFCQALSEAENTNPYQKNIRWKCPWGLQKNSLAE